jgi:hypothetical protein
MRELPPMREANGARANSRKRWRRWAATARIWHRRIGLVIAALVAVLAVTGLLLNHGDRLDLDRINVKAGWLVAWYGLDPVEAPVHFRAGEHWVSWIDGAVYAHGRKVGDASGAPLGAVAFDSLVAVATTKSLVVLTPEGELVERLGAALLPGTITRVGTAISNRIVIDSPEGRFASDSDLLSWGPIDEEVAWSEASTPTEAVLEQQLAGYRGQGLPLSRVLLDLHSGRLFGSVGAAVMDAAAIFLLVLVATGVVNWAGFRRPRR